MTASQESPPRTVRVAVVDDQREVVEAFTRVLSSRPGFAVVATGATGEDAVAIAEREHPDVVVLDVRMPRMDGITATRAITGRGSDGPRVLVVTTFNLDSAVYEALQAGASGFLLKDAAPQAFVDAVLTVARGDAIVDPAVTRALIGKHADRIRPRAPQSTAVAQLTARELEVLRLLAEGMSNMEIAEAMVVTRETVKTYVSRLLNKLDLRDRVQAVVLAHRIGLVDS